MLVGIDSYCFHRHFGEVYPQQASPSTRMTMEDFVQRAHELRVDGVSLESCFFPEYSKEYLAELKAMLDQYRLERVYAWGHPDGLEGGTNEDAHRDMLASFERAQAIGATVMRVVGSSLRSRKEAHEPQIRRLTARFRDAVKTAQEYGIR